MPGLVGRIFREFAITIVISIFASGIVSLTLTPLMTSRMLADRGHDAKKTWMERAVGRIEKRVLAFYGRSLDWFLRRRWISALIWAICLAGTIALFIVVPKTFLPEGDSGVVNGVFIAQEGSSPQQMQALQERVSQAVRDEPSVDRSISVTGLSTFLSSNQGLTYIFLKPGERRPPVSTVAGRLMGRIAAIPGVFPFLRPYPVLQISTGATSQNQGQYAFSISGVNPDQVYEAADKLLEKLRPYPGFATLSSDRFNHTPNLEIDIRRDQAKILGVSETRILGLLRNAYSQNYQYLIKKPDDQYQVILEVRDRERSNADDLSLLYIKSDDGKNLVPLDALVKWRTSLGPQAVNHLNQFTSVTLFFNLKPGVAVGDATSFVERAAREVVPPTVRASLQGEALTFRDTVRNLTILMLLAVFGRSAHALDLPRAGLALRVRRDVHADGHREEERHHDRRLRAAAHRRGRHRGARHPPGEHRSLPPDHHDHRGGGDRRAAHRAGVRRRRRVPAAARSRDRRRAGRLAVHHPLHHARHLPVPGGVPGEGAGPRRVLPIETAGRGAGAGGLIHKDRARLREVRQRCR